ncbi:MAG: type II secretion system protein N, partial [Burkholderiaceae bacterium]
AALRGAAVGAVFGAGVAFVANIPAAWVAQGVAAATGQRLLLADARGTLWSGSAAAVLTGGPQSRDASALPGRLEWSLTPRAYGFELTARHACCLNGSVAVQLRPGFGRLMYTVLPSPGWIGQWPSSWLGGLGTPWNTLQLGGAVRLVSPGVRIESVQGRWRIDGRADIELLSVSSRMTTLNTLGNYRLSVSGDSAQGSTSRLQLSTQDGALQLSGEGSLGPSGLRFRGEARADAADEPALNNLLNIIGRREGARSVISIG